MVVQHDLWCMQGNTALHWLLHLGSWYKAAKRFNDEELLATLLAAGCAVNDQKQQGAVAYKSQMLKACACEQYSDLQLFQAETANLTQCHVNVCKPVCLYLLDSPLENATQPQGGLAQSVLQYTMRWSLSATHGHICASSISSSSKETICSRARCWPSVQHAPTSWFS